MADELDLALLVQARNRLRAHDLAAARGDALVRDARIHRAHDVLHHRAAVVRLGDDAVRLVALVGARDDAAPGRRAGLHREILEEVAHAVDTESADHDPDRVRLFAVVVRARRIDGDHDAQHVRQARRIEYARLLDSLQRPERVRVRVAELALEESLAHTGRHAFECREVIRGQVFDVVPRVHLERDVSVRADERLLAGRIDAPHEKRIQPVALVRRVAVVVHPRRHDVRDVGALDLVDALLREAGKRRVPRVVADLRRLVQHDRRVLGAQDLVGALFVVEAAEPNLGAVLQGRVQIGLVQRVIDLRKADLHHLREGVEHELLLRVDEMEPQERMPGPRGLERPHRGRPDDLEGLAGARAAVEQDVLAAREHFRGLNLARGRLIALRLHCSAPTRAPRRPSRCARRASSTRPAGG